MYMKVSLIGSVTFYLTLLQNVAFSETLTLPEHNLVLPTDVDIQSVLEGNIKSTSR